MRVLLTVFVAAIFLVAARDARAAEAPGRYEGVLGNAPYLIDVPPDWNGGLVIFAHG
jgi:hypothetical protein